jgi:manganese/zinc/iron transport system permease protein
MGIYFGKHFFGVLQLFVMRSFEICQGNISLLELASDEVQALVLIGVAISSSLAGTFLVLKKMTMLANSLSHTILIGIVLAYLLFFSQMTPFGMDLKVLLGASLLVALITVFLTQFFQKVVRLPEDASIGLVFTSLFALGVTIVTLFARNTHLEVEAVMGNVDALHANDAKLMGWVVLFNLFFIFLFFKEYKISAFDPALSTSLGISPALFNFFLMIQTSVTAIGAFRAVGVLLVLAFLVIPPITARLFTPHLGRLLLFSVFLSSMAAVCAVALSRHILSVYHISLSTAGLVVCLLAFIYCLVLLSKLTFRRNYG